MSYSTVNIPYSDWEEKQPKLLRNILEVTKENNMKLGIVDNIYAYGRQVQGLVKEDADKEPHTKKGKIRLQLEMMAEQRAKMFIAHFPDFTVQQKAHSFIIL